MRLLSLPFFSTEFADLLIVVQLDTVEKWLAIEADTPDQCAQEISLMAPSMVPSVSGVPCLISMELVEKHMSSFMKFWLLVLKAGPKLLTDTAQCQGFGLATGRAISGPLTLALTKVVRAPLLKKARVNEPRVQELDPEIKMLLDQEMTLKEQWVARLEVICEKAGDLARINDQQFLDGSVSPEDRKRLRKLVLSMGAYGTMATHVRHWERFERWAKGKGTVYPPTLSLLISYVLFLSNGQCGPTVIASVRSAVNWIGTRIQMEIPDTSDPTITAMDMQVLEERGKELKEAIPLRMCVVGMLEDFMMLKRVEKPCLAVFTGWILCMIYASLRFDDALHVKTTSLEMNDKGLSGLAWQTKVERKRRGTKFAVPHAGLRQPDWLVVWWELFQEVCPGDRDFWIFDLASQDRFALQPVSYHRGLKYLLWVVSQALLSALELQTFPESIIQECMSDTEALTWHSLRVTMLNEMVHNGNSSQQVALQANWKSGDAMVLKYTRNRRQIPLVAVGQLLSVVKEAWSPLAREPGEPIVPEGESFSEDEHPLGSLPRTYYVKSSLIDKVNIRMFTIRYHMNSISEPVLTACKKFKLEECCPMGSELPDVSMLCHGCRKNRDRGF